MERAERERDRLEWRGVWEEKDVRWGGEREGKGRVERGRDSLARCRENCEREMMEGRGEGEGEGGGRKRVESDRSTVDGGEGPRLGWGGN